MCGSLAGILFLRHFRTIPVLGRMIFSMMVCIRWFFYWFCISLVSLSKPRPLIGTILKTPGLRSTKRLRKAYTSEIQFYHLLFQKVIMSHDSCGLFDKVVRIRSGKSRSLAEFYQCMCVEIWSKDLVSKFRMGNQFKAFSSFFLTVFYNKIFQNLIRL